MNAHEEWLKARKTGIGGSDIAAILGLSPYRTPVDVWAEKTGRATAQDETLQMRFGRYAEEFVAREYTAKTGNACSALPRCCTTPRRRCSATSIAW